MRQVTATATRVGSWWAIEVPEVPGAFSQARRLSQVAAMAADAVATLTGETVSVEVVHGCPCRSNARWRRSGGRRRMPPNCWLRPP